MIVLRENKIDGKYIKMVAQREGIGICSSLAVCMCVSPWLLLKKKKNMMEEEGNEYSTMEYKLNWFVVLKKKIQPFKKSIE